MLNSGRFFFIFFLFSDEDFVTAEDNDDDHDDDDGSSSLGSSESNDTITVHIANTVNFMRVQTLSSTGYIVSELKIH